MTSCFGSSSGAALTQLMAQGALNVYLTQNPSITYWRQRYNRHTNFSMEAIQQPFGSQVSFGGEVQVLVNRTGDLLFWQYVMITLPAITSILSTSAVCSVGGGQFPCALDPCDPCGDGPEPDNCICPRPAVSSAQEDDFDLDSPIDTCTGLTSPWVHYTNAIGQFLIKRACLVIGGQNINTLYNDYLYMWEELAGKPGKRLLEMIGKRFTRAQLVADSQQTRVLYVPLPWFFCRDPGNALPLVSLQFHGVQVNVCFETLVRSVQVSDCESLVVKCCDCQPLVNSDLNASLLSTYVYLDVEERDAFATGQFEQLVTQVQAFTTTAKSSQVRINLNFNHAMIELLWMVRRKCQELHNNHFNYSGKWGRDPIASVQLCLNNLSRFAAREGRYFRLVQPYQHHTLIPESFTYCYSFALHPESDNPSGSVNFSRIDNVELIFDLQDALANEEVTVRVFGRNWNLFRYREGLGGLAFAN